MRNWKKRAASLILSGVCAITPCVYAAPAAMFTASAEESFTEKDVLNGYTYQAYNLGNVGKYEFANTVDNCFRVKWEKTQESSFSKGKNFDDEQYYAADFEEYNVEYDADVNFDGACTLSVSGFLEEPKLQYHILEGWSEFCPNSDKKIATYTSGGHTYEAYMFYQTTGGDLIGGDGWNEIWSIRTDSEVKSKEDVNIKGNVNVAEHFREWEKAGVILGTVSNVSLDISGFTSSGSVNVNSFNLEGYISSIPYAIHVADPYEGLPHTDYKTDENGYIYGAFTGSGEFLPESVMEIENTDNNGFNGSWDGEYDCEIYKGKLFEDDGIAPEDFGDYYVSYEGDINCTGTSCLLSANGWMREPKNHFYILDYCCGWRQFNDNNIKPVTTYEVDGNTYDVYLLTISKGDIITTDLMHEIWSIRRDSEIKPGEDTHVKGKINVSEHFKAWEKAGLSMGNVMNIDLSAKSFESKGNLKISSLEIGGEIKKTDKKDSQKKKITDSGYFYDFDPQVKDFTYESTGNNGFTCDWPGLGGGMVTYLCKGKKFIDKSFNTADCDEYNISYDADINFDRIGDFSIFGRMEEKKLSFMIYEHFSEWKPYKDDIYKPLLTYKVNGSTYNLYKDERGGDLIGNVYWTMLYCVKTDPEISAGEDANIKGSFNLAEHFRAWKKAGFTLGTVDEVCAMVECVDGGCKIKLNSLEIGSDEDTVLVGDLNNDGCIDVFDIILCRKALISKINGDKVSYNADVNGDGEFSVSDLVMLSGFVSGKKTDFTADNNTK